VLACRSVWSHAARVRASSPANLRVAGIFHQVLIESSWEPANQPSKVRLHCGWEHSPFWPSFPVEHSVFFYVDLLITRLVRRLRSIGHPVAKAVD
jgi:hypothetical protein